MHSMDLCAVGCCTGGLISVLYVPLTVRSSRKCSLLRLHGLQLSAECREKVLFLFSTFVGLIRLILSKIYSLCYLDYTWIDPNAN